MTKYDFFKALGYVDEEIVEEANNASTTEKRVRFSTLAVACALITALSLASGIIMYGVNVHRQKAVKKETVNIVVNEIDPLNDRIYFESKRLQKVPSEIWRSTFTYENFFEKFEKHEAKYFMLWDEKYFKNNYLEEYKMAIKPTYGMIRFKLDNVDKVEMIALSNSTGPHYKLLKRYRNLSKSKIGDYEVIVCKEVKSDWGVIICGSGQYDYSFEVSREYTKEELVAVLKEILE